MCGPERQTNYSNPVADVFTSGGDGYRPRVRTKKADKAAYEPHMHTSICSGSCSMC